MCRPVRKTNPVCGICVKLKSLLKQHIHAAHSVNTKCVSGGNRKIVKKTFKCKHCKEVFERISQRNRHLLKHHPKEEKSQTVDSSCVKFEQEDTPTVEGSLPLFSYDDLAYSPGFGHYESDTIDDVSYSEKPKTNTFKCKYCDFTASGNGGLTRHIKGEHPTVRPYRCKLCTLSFKSVAARANHVAKTHESNDTKPLPDEAEIDEADFDEADFEDPEPVVKKKKKNKKEKRILKPGRKLSVAQARRKAKQSRVSTDVMTIVETLGDSFYIELFDEESKTKTFQCNLCNYKSGRRHDIKRHYDRHIRRRGKSRVDKSGVKDVSEKADDVKSDVTVEGDKVAESVESNVKKEPLDKDKQEEEKSDDEVVRKKRKITDRIYIEIYDESKNVKKYQCIFCNYKSLRRFDVRRHFQCRHNGIGIGDDDDKEAVADPELSESIGKIGTVEEIISKLSSSSENAHGLKSRKKNLVCEICGKKCKYAKHLLDHMNIHLGKRPYLCDICGIDFTHKSYLVKHRRLHTGEKFVECQICQKRYPTACELRIHENAHTGNRPYWCEFCGKGFMGTGNLRIHLRIHTGEKPYKCKLCDYRCIQSNSLKKHMHACHGGTYDYPCQLCNSKFKFKSHLNAHMLRHKGVLRHFCEFCGKGFVFSWGLVEHRRTHTHDRPFKCMFCNQAFYRNTQLNQHMRNHHPGIPWNPSAKRSSQSKANSNNPKTQSNNSRMHSNTTESNNSKMHSNATESNNASMHSNTTESNNSRMHSNNASMHSNTNRMESNTEPNMPRMESHTSGMDSIDYRTEASNSRLETNFPRMDHNIPRMDANTSNMPPPHPHVIDHNASLIDLSVPRMLPNTNAMESNMHGMPHAAPPWMMPFRF